MQYLQLVREIVVILTTVTAGVVAVVGLRTWRAQLRGRTEYDLARRLLRSVYRVRDALQAVRAPLITSGEMTVALKAEGVDLSELDRDTASERGRVAAYAQRWKDVTDATGDLELETLEAEVLWGDLLKDADQGLKRCVLKLHADLDMILNYEKDLDRQERRKLRETVYRISPDDPYTTTLNEAVAAIATLVRPKLKL